MTSWSSALMANDSPIRVLRKPGRTMRTASWRLPVQRLNPWWITTKRWLSVLPLWKLTKIASKLHLAGQLLALFMVVSWTAFAQVRRPLSSTKTLEQVLKTGYAPPHSCTVFRPKHYQTSWYLMKFACNFTSFYIHVSICFLQIFRKSLYSCIHKAYTLKLPSCHPISQVVEATRNRRSLWLHGPRRASILENPALRLWLAECGVP